MEKDCQTVKELYTKIQKQFSGISNKTIDNALDKLNTRKIITKKRDSKDNHKKIVCLSSTIKNEGMISLEERTSGLDLSHLYSEQDEVYLPSIENDFLLLKQGISDNLDNIFTSIVTNNQTEGMRAFNNLRLTCKTDPRYFIMALHDILEKYSSHARYISEFLELCLKDNQTNQTEQKRGY
jgi:flagellar motor component MotA